ncbi:family 16 glycosylhydrolase [Flavobacterium sp. IMCC34852]|uniref:Family 16 glycosylhydrolase n=1 Tax=Flavobacterium rivulicola TaxID=2732161 RepID=A0A7Y3RBA9_9FLAO|nr:family 16 glycosylhydrolase [Flavobacterium sp. IMCC34852]NNT72861.1 family 16 glycosylhydrolase [Flavobacterium sp. IMCC34852]
MISKIISSVRLSGSGHKYPKNNNKHMSKKNTLFQIFLTLFLSIPFGYSQVDVVYTNLVWSDEFDNNGAVNSSKWHHQTQLPAGGSWFNGEVQHYTDQLTNSFVNSGFLNIVAKKEPYTSQGITKQYTSARLNSKFSFLYGRVDVRAKIPTNQGTWPAIWMLGKNVNEDGGFFDSQFGTTNWPACGEIDIMEHGITPSQPVNYIQSALHTPSSFGNTTNIGGTIANNLGNDFHVYSMNWSPFQISFLLDGVVFYTYNPAVKTPSNWPFNAEQYLLLNIAMGGVAGAIPSNFTQAAMEIDYVRVYQNTLVDTQAPTNFTASIGTVTSSTIELLLNAEDNSGNVNYNITYSGGTIALANPSGVPRSVIVPNLMPNTNYTFSVTASDLAGNTFVANPIVLNATTSGVIGCSGTDTEAQAGTFSIGYNYAFETIGTDVKITFEMLDTDKVGVVAFLWRQSPFTEYQMTNVSGNIFTKTITGQTIGSTISYAVKFAYAGGLSVTRFFSYVVGSNCALDIPTSSELSQLCYPNPVEGILHLQLQDHHNQISLTDILGKKHFEMVVSAREDINMSDLKPGIYFLRIQNSRGIQHLKIVKK